MPIAAELRSHYGRQWREQTRVQILERDGDACRRCKKPNHAIVETITGRTDAGELYMSWRLAAGIIQPKNPSAIGEAGPWTLHTGKPAEDPEWPRTWEDFSPTRFERWKQIYSLIGVAHLNHKAGDNRPSNLESLCAWCHIVHDRPQHHQSRGTRKDRARPLFGRFMGSREIT